VAKRKRKRKTAPNATSRKKRGIFWGDGLLAFFYFLQGTILLIVLGVYASFGLSLEFVKPIKTDVLKQTTEASVRDLINNVNQIQGIGLAIALVGLVPLLFLLIRGIARGSKFAMIFVFLENAASITAMLMSTLNEARLGAILPILIMIYSLLRLFGSIGPKIK
jgi:hypothetical protein